MKSEYLMRVSALVLGLIGLAASFLPGEILAHFGAPPSQGLEIALQIAGAAYMGFAVLNWMARFNLIGGIYSRPVAMGNFLHFMVVAITLLKFLLDGEAMVEVIAGAAVYSALALWFGVVAFTHPIRKKPEQAKATRSTAERDVKPAT